MNFQIVIPKIRFKIVWKKHSLKRKPLTHSLNADIVTEKISDISKNKKNLKEIERGELVKTILILR